MDVGVMGVLAVVKAPCAKCPFRKDVPIYLRRGRRQEIAEALVEGGDFPCHATVDYSEDGEGTESGSGGATCAGAAKAIMAAGGTTQLMRIAERLGAADLDDVAVRGAEVWDLDDWTRLAEGSTGDAPVWEVGGEDGEVRACCTVDDGCLAPAGFLSSSGAVVRGSEEADGECVECGEPLCSNCADPEGLCSMCRDWSEDDEDGDE
jgi:hypothetical protein